MVGKPEYPALLPARTTMPPVNAAPLGLPLSASGPLPLIEPVTVRVLDDSVVGGVRDVLVAAHGAIWIAPPAAPITTSCESVSESPMNRSAPPLSVTVFAAEPRLAFCSTLRMPKLTVIGPLKLLAGFMNRVSRFSVVAWLLIVTPLFPVIRAFTATGETVAKI
jgi:hypothetical protein